ncbi:lysoplasmalogenase [Nocardioides cynanchi]|uniref:lysoplasmalogenase n=1 Tax=Nocardioides cynanchi TaxID=2558918 RepID=UPI001243ED20|nr:lysoplasmalogenase [Nocardioides cynanchi]
MTVSLVWILPAAFALTDWYAVSRGDRRTEVWAKPATLVALILTAVALGATDSAAGRWLLVGLACGLAGDVFLLDKGDTRFRLGLAAFLVGHLAFVVSFIQLRLDPQGWNYASLLVLGGCLLATRQVAASTYLRGGLALAAPVGLYTVVIGAMVIYAFTTGQALIAVGASVFALSDTVLARDRFVRPWDGAQLVVMVTYHVGQALIVLGVLAAA